MVFDFIERTGSQSKISVVDDIAMWKMLNQIINDLLLRCNSANGSSIQSIVLYNQETKGDALSANEYDTNITNIQNVLNSIIQYSSDQGLNPDNALTLFKRSSQSIPLLMWQRDSNLRTIQTAVNTISNLYIWNGA